MAFFSNVGINPSLFTKFYSNGTNLVVGDVSILWASDGGGSIGAVGATRPANVYASTLITAPTITASTGLRVGGDAGSGTASHLVLTNATLAPDAGEGSATLAKMPTGGDEAQSGWLKAFTGTTLIMVPYWVMA